MSIRGIMEMVGYRILFQCAMVLGKGQDLPRACVTLIERLEQLVFVTHGGHTRVESEHESKHFPWYIPYVLHMVTFLYLRTN